MVLIVGVELTVPVMEGELGRQEVFCIDPDVAALCIISSRPSGMTDECQMVRWAAIHLVVALEGEGHLPFAHTPLVFTHEQGNSLAQACLVHRMVGMPGCQGARRIQRQMHKP